MRLLLVEAARLQAVRSHLNPLKHPKPGRVGKSAAMQFFGPAAFFGSVIVLHTSFALYAAWRKHTTDAVPRPEKTRFVSASPQVAPTGRLAAPEAKPGET